MGYSRDAVGVLASRPQGSRATLFGNVLTPAHNGTADRDPPSGLAWHPASLATAIIWFLTPEELKWRLVGDRAKRIRLPPSFDPGVRARDSCPKTKRFRVACPA